MAPTTVEQLVLMPPPSWNRRSKLALVNRGSDRRHHTDSSRRGRVSYPGQLQAIRDNLSRIKLLRRKNRSNPPQIRRIRSIFEKKYWKRIGGEICEKSWGKEFFGAYFKTPKCGHYLKRKSPPPLPSDKKNSYPKFKNPPIFQLDILSLL